VGAGVWFAITVAHSKKRQLLVRRASQKVWCLWAKALSVWKKRCAQSFRINVLSDYIHILVGTQILAKGHDFAGLTFVGIISADQALYGTDFRAIERMGQMVTQVAGRAGRGAQRGEVILQTHEPEHPLLRTLVEGGYGALSDALLEERRMAGLPPFSRCCALKRRKRRRPCASSMKLVR